MRRAWLPLALIAAALALRAADDAPATATPGAAAPAADAAPPEADRATLNALEVTRLLKSAIFPAEVQFQAGGYRDEDGNNVGEYGYLDELSGRRGTAKVAAGTLRLLQGPLAQGDVAFGYHFSVFLADGVGGAVDASEDSPAAAKTAAHTRERYFIAYAWPETPEDGDQVFALAQDGQVRAAKWTGRPARWRDAFAAGARFGGELGWDVFEPTPEMERVEYERNAVERDGTFLKQVGEAAAFVRMLGGQWPLDCDAIVRLCSQRGGAVGRQPRRAPRTPAFAYVRPRDPYDAKRPVLVQDPGGTRDHAAFAVFVELPAADAADYRPRVGVLRLQGDAAARVWAAAQAATAKPETARDGAGAEAWAGVADALTPDAIDWRR